MANLLFISNSLVFIPDVRVAEPSQLIRFFSFKNVFEIFIKRRVFIEIKELLCGKLHQFFTYHLPNDLFQLLNSQGDCRFLCFGHIGTYLNCPFVLVSLLKNCRAL